MIGRYRIWWQLLALALVVTAAAGLSRKFNRQLDMFVPETFTFASVHNRKESGYSGLFELARKAGLAVDTWEYPYRELARVRGTLVVVAPNIARTDLDERALLQWVRRGNNLVYLDQCAYGAGAKFLKELSCVPEDQPPRVVDEVVPLAPVPESAFVKRGLTVSAVSRLVGGTTVAADKAGALLVSLRCGRGRCLVGTVGDLAANRRLTDRRCWPNFQFMINWLRAGGGEVYFDERCHGFSRSRNLLLFLASSPAGYVGAQLGLVLALAVMSHANRFGQALSVPARRRVSNMEFVEGLAATYRRARAADAAWATIFNAEHARLCKTLSVSPEAPPDTIATAWAALSGHSRRDCESFLGRAESALGRRGLSEETLVALVAELDQLSGPSSR